MSESSARSGWAFQEDVIRSTSNMFLFVKLLSFSSENRCENTFRPLQPTRPVRFRIGCGLPVIARSEAKQADARVACM